MEKTGQMIEFEQETGKQSAILKFITGGQALEQKSYPKLGPYDYNTEYLAWLEAKATAYDRLMSGGKKTLKEVANFLESIIAIDAYGVPRSFDKMPSVAENIRWQYDSDFGHEGIAKYLRGEPLRINIDFTGDWKDSLTLPDGWEEK